MVKKIKQEEPATRRTAVTTDNAVIQRLLTCRSRPMCLIHLSAINVIARVNAVMTAPVVNTGRPQSEAPTFEMYARCWALHISGKCVDPCETHAASRVVSVTTKCQHPLSKLLKRSCSSYLTTPRRRRLEESNMVFQGAWVSA